MADGNLGQHDGVELLRAHGRRPRIVGNAKHAPKRRCQGRKSDTGGDPLPTGEAMVTPPGDDGQHGQFEQEAQGEIDRIRIHNAIYLIIVFSRPRHSWFR